MTQHSAAQRAMEKIMKGEVIKRPRVRFVLFNIALWFFGVLSVFVGALIVSIIIFTITNSDMDLHREIYGCAVPRITFVIIGVWVLLTGLFITLCDVSIRHTNRGYVYPLWAIVAINFLLSVALGAMFYKVGVSYYVDHLLGTHMPYYYNVDKRRMMLFNMPEKGIIMGQIISYDPSYVVIMTPEDHLLAVSTGNIDPQKQERLQASDQVVFLGRVNEDGVFVACDVRARQINGIRQTIKDKLRAELEEREIDEQEQIVERIHVMPHPISYICNEQVRWRVAEEE
jgi:hypothetical protein